jgi:hypothetical protein
MWARTALVVAAGGGLVACSLLVSLDGLNGGGGGSQDASGPGSAGQACFPNGTCDEGLTCVSNVCVATSDASAGDDGAVRGDASSDSGPSALACGSALFTGSSGGAGGVVSAPHIAAYNPSGAFTIEAWVYPTAYPSAGLATIAAHETPSNRSWTLGIDPTGAINFVFSSDGTTLTTAAVSNSYTLPLNTWSHVVGEFDGISETMVWEDGFSSANAYPSVATVNPVTAPLTIGNASGGNAPFTGRIEEVRVSTGFLYPASANGFEPDARLSSSASTLALFHLDDGTKIARDASTHGNDATVLNDATLTNDCAPGVCSWVHLTGGTINVPMPTPDVLTPAHSFTIEGWFREISPDTAVTNGSGGYALYQDDIMAYVGFGFTCSGGGSGSYSVASGSSPFPRSTWHHWAGVFDAVAETITLYVDGVNVASKATGCTSSAAATGLTFGNGQYDIAEVRLSSVVRYSANFAPEKIALRFATDPATLALYHFDEGSGTLAHDSSGTFTDGGLNGYFEGSPLPSFAQCQ